MQHRLLFRLAFFLLLMSAAASAQSPFAPKVSGPLSQRVVAYTIDAKYDPPKHVVEATETLTYHNLTGQAQDTFPFHLYLNAFQPNSTSPKIRHRARWMLRSQTNARKIPRSKLKRNQTGGANRLRFAYELEDRLKRLFAASPEQMEAIDGILEFGIQKRPMATTGPLLMGMSASAKLLGVSRATLWRMTKAGLLQKIEVLPGSFRLRRADLEAIAAGQRNVGSS